MKKNGSENKTSLIFTRETLGMTILLFCFVVVLALFSGRAIFAGFGGAICTFMYGTFGYGCFLVMALLAYLGVYLAFEKKVRVKPVPAVLAALTVYALFLLFHAVSTRDFAVDGTYISQCYNAASQGFPHYTFGGVLSAVLVYPVALLTTFVGAYIIFAALAVLAGVYTVRSFLKYYRRKAIVSAGTDDGARASDAASAVHGYGAGGYEEEGYPLNYAVQPGRDAHTVPSQTAYEQSAAAYGQSERQAYAEQPARQPYFTAQHMQPEPSHEDDDRFSPSKLGRKILFDNDEFAAESYRRNGIFDENSYFNHPITNKGDYLRGFSDGKSKPAAEGASYSEAYRRSVEREQSSANSGMVYGDAPVQNLYEAPDQARRITSYEAPSQSEQPQFRDAERRDNAVGYGGYVPPAAEQPAHDDYSAGTGEESEPDFGAPETDINGNDELWSMPEDDEDRRTDPRRLDDDLFGGRDGAADDGEVMPDRSFGVRGEGLSGQDHAARTSEEPERGTFGQSPENLFGDRRESAQDIFPDRGGRLCDDALSGGRHSSDKPNDDEVIKSDDSRAEDFSDFRRGEGGRRPVGFTDGGEDETPARSDISSLFSSSNSRLGENRIEPDISAASRGSRSNADLFDDDGPGPQDDEPEQPVRSDCDIPVRADSVQSAPEKSAAVPEEKPAEAPKPHVWKKYVHPSLDLLDDYPEYNSAATAEVEECKRLIVDTLNVRKVECEISDVTVAPALTRYDVTIFDRTSVNKNLLKHRDAIAMALRRDNVNVYLNFAKGALSVEVPNINRTVVGLKNVMMSPAFMNAKANSLTFAFGKNLDSVCVCPDIRKMPHLLVAGTSGSGKSICLNSLLVSLISRYGPNELRLILVDPKQVEFVSYDKLPHLMINEIIHEADKAIKALNWAIKEMERRYTAFKEMSESGTKAKDGKKIATTDIDGYNAHVEDEAEKLPKLLIVLDEFGDLMLQAKKDVESRIIRLAAKGRAAGIHLILATQRPSVDCITGLIKSNLDARIGFKVGSLDDSRTIFDVGGAEKLLGKGDAYFRSKEYADGKMQRIQGCYIGPEEVQKITDFIKANNETYFEQSISDFINTVEEPEQAESLVESADAEDTKIDDAYLRALKYCVTSNSASVSMLQRRFPIGYVKACKIVDWMENMNYITKNEGSKSRKVLLSLDEFIKTYGDIDD